MFFLKRGFAPLKLPFLLQKWGEEILGGQIPSGQREEILGSKFLQGRGKRFRGANSFKAEGRGFREGRSPSLTYTPPSLSKGRGSGG